jgi:GNAT superfamily N-acetyltransferase
VTVLRGMRVHRDLRRSGIGRQLLDHLDQVLGNTTCYCIPFAWLTGFYGAIGFVQIETPAAPAFLSERYAVYVEQGLNMIIMRRPG